MTSAEPAAQRSSAIHGGVAVRSPDGARVCAVRIAQLANFIGPASGGVRTAVAAMGEGYVDAGVERLLVVPGPADVPLRLEVLPRQHAGRERSAAAAGS